MKKVVFFCNCGGLISDKIDASKVEQSVASIGPDTAFETVDLLCSKSGLVQLGEGLKRHDPDRVVITACSLRDHEGTFRGALSDSGTNPYLMQMVNVREQVAWVTEDPQQATAKATRLLSAALERAELHEPLETREIDICPDAVVIGAGPAGLKAALCLASAGRKVTLVEKSELVGGMPVRYDELFPTLECGSCMLEPILDEALHGEHAKNIEILTLSEVVEVLGYFGNFTVKIRQRARFVDPEVCVGCADVCAEACPVSGPNEIDYGLGQRKAISVPFLGALPNVPSVDRTRCVHFQGEDCSSCVDACLVERAIRFDQKDQDLERSAGAIIVATGGDLHDHREMPNFGGAEALDVFSSVEFERLLTMTGPSGGAIQTHTGEEPRSIAIVHCVGSLEEKYRDYCSGTCCEMAFKFNHIIRKRLPNTRCMHFVREIVTSGKEGFRLARQAQQDPKTFVIRYRGDDGIKLRSDGETITIHSWHDRPSELSVDMAVLCPASIPGAETEELSTILDIGLDRYGFFEERHGWTEAVQSTTKGIYIAGACHEPMHIQSAMSQGVAAAGHALAGLVPGRKLQISPVHAVVDESRCSGCRVCIGVCPYRALSYDATSKVARVNDVLCTGCGTCIAGCPSASISGNHFTDGQILAEIEGLLA